MVVYLSTKIYLRRTKSQIDGGAILLMMYLWTRVWYPAKNKGVADIQLSIDNTLQFTPDGKLSVVPKILMQSDLEMKATAPIKLILDSDVDPLDPIISTLLLDHDHDHFEVSDSGKFDHIEMSYKGFGGIKIGGVGDFDDILEDWFTPDDERHRCQEDQRYSP